MNPLAEFDPAILDDHGTCLVLGGNPSHRSSIAQTLCHSKPHIPVVPVVDHHAVLTTLTDRQSAVMGKGKNTTGRRSKWGHSSTSITVSPTPPTKLALGVGLGIGLGLPVIVLLIFFVVRRCRQRAP
jgi:hypothetical protein